jgi:hypothetical protein
MIRHGQEKTMESCWRGAFALALSCRHTERSALPLGLGQLEPQQARLYNLEVVLASVTYF